MSIGKVYRLYADVTGCATYIFDAYKVMDYWDDYLFHYFRGQPLPEGWQMPRYEVGAPDKPLHDFVHGESVAPFVSNKAKQALETVTGNSVQFWRIGKVHGRDYFILNVVRVVDCLDPQKSDILYASDVPVKMLGIRKAVFDREKIPCDAVIFKVPQDPGIIYVTDSFVDCVQKHRLSGVGFEHPDDVGVSGPKNAFPDLPIRWVGRQVWSGQGQA